MTDMNDILNIPGFNPQGDGSEWDGLHTNVYDPDRNLVAQYSQGETPEIYMGSNGRFYQGVPGTPEYDRMQSAHRRSTRRGVATVAALVGGAAAAGALGGAGAAGAGTTSHTGQALITGSNAARGALAAAPAAESAGAAALMGIPSGAGIAAAPLTGGMGAVAANPGFWANAGGALRGYFMNPNGTVNIPNAIKGGTIALGALGAANSALNPPDQPGPPPGWTQGNDVLPQVSYSRNRLAGPTNPRNYGKQGGEHRFFTDPVRTDGATPLAASAGQGAGALPTKYFPMNEAIKGTRFSGGGGVSGPGTGRSDSIEALLSDGEYVIDAESVALLGDGSLDAGAARLDQLRQNLRKHKGAALAKGEFTPAAKSPEAYMAKGGRMRVVAGKDTTGQRIQKVQQMRGLEDQLKAERDDLPLQEALKRLEGLRALASKNPLKKAEGGAVSEMEGLADKLETALKLGDVGAIDGAMGEIKVGLAKGGRVQGDDVVNAILEKYRPKQPASPEEFQSIVEHLRRMKPGSEALRQYESSQQPRTYRPSEQRRAK